MAVIVYIPIFPQLCFVCVHMPISGLSSLVQFLYMPLRKTFSLPAFGHNL